MGTELDAAVGIGAGALDASAGEYVGMGCGGLIVGAAVVRGAMAGLGEGDQVVSKLSWVGAGPGNIGRFVGPDTGTLLCLDVGLNVGSHVGNVVGFGVGKFVGDDVGAGTGTVVGKAVEGEGVGFPVGLHCVQPAQEDVHVHLLVHDAPLVSHQV